MEVNSRCERGELCLSRYALPLRIKKTLSLVWPAKASLNVTETLSFRTLPEGGNVPKTFLTPVPILSVAGVC